MPEIITVDDLSIEVRRSSRRKNISIVVDRGGQLVIAAPENCAQEKLLSVIKSKKQWIHMKLIDKEKQLSPTPPVKEYVSGEGFHYLGKSYRLRIIEPDPTQARTPVFRFCQGQFELRSDERYNGREHFIKWYTNRCYSWLENRLPEYGKRVQVEMNKLSVTDLGYRWGSCSSSQINFHWRLILLPVHIIEYVVVHELAHLHEPDHGDEFWKIVDRVIPDWQERKNWLALNGVRYGI